MLDLAVIDSTPEARNSLLIIIDKLLGKDISDLIPNLSIYPLAPEEIKLRSEPDIIIIGNQIIRENIKLLRDLRELLPETVIFVSLNNTQDSSFIEQIARLGVDDIIDEDIESKSLINKLIIISNQKLSTSNGKLIIIDSAKGGVGATSITAAIGETIIEKGKSVLLIDMDYRNQNLSRFLQARPFINKNFNNLIEGKEVINKQSLEACLAPVWYDEDNFRVLTPAPAYEGRNKEANKHLKNFKNLIEVIKDNFDYVVVDNANIKSTFLELLHKLCDSIVFILNPSNASLYASIDKISQIQSQIHLNTKILIVENRVSEGGFKSKITQKEFLNANRLNPDFWFNKNINFSKKAMMWPGSGKTLYSASNRITRKTFHQLINKLGLTSFQNSSNKSSKLIEWKPFNKSKYRKGTLSKKECKNIALIEEKQKDLPERQKQTSNPLNLINIIGGNTKNNKEKNSYL